jgi:hypothetical protein
MTLTEKPTTVELQVQPRRHPVAQLVAGGVILVIGVLWLVERLGWVDLSVTAVLGIATMVTGIALMVLARESAHVGLIILGTVLGLLATLTALAPFEGFQGGIGDRTLVIDSVDDISADYNLAMGKLVIDLRQVDDFTAESSLSASVGTGDLVVRVPDGTQVALDARVGAGQLDVFGIVTEGVGIERSFETPGYEPDAPGIDLDLAAFAGRVEVTDE